MWTWTRDWIKLRRHHSALRNGQLIDLYYDDDTYIFARQNQSETVIIAINRGSQENEITVPAGAIGLRDGSELVPLQGASVVSQIADGNATLRLPSRLALAFRVR